MTSHMEQDGKYSGSFGMFESLDKCLAKNAYGTSHVIFDSGCLADGVPGTPEKEGLLQENTMESTFLESSNHSSGAGEVNFMSGQYTMEEKPATNSTAGKKRKRPITDPSNGSAEDFKSQLCSMLEASSKVLTAHVESHNLNCELDRNQRKQNADNLVSALSKCADALGKIAERL